MKKILKRNKVMITALALMVVIAGYLHFAGTQVSTQEMIKQEESVESSSVSVNGIVEYNMDGQIMSSGELSDISEEDLEYYAQIESLDSEDLTLEEEYVNELETALQEGEEYAEMDEETAELVAWEDPVLEEELAQVEEVPGEAVYTSTTTITSLSAARLKKEQTRASANDTLMEVIDDVNVSEEQKQAAIDHMLVSADIAEREAAAEIMLEAKGYTEAVVSISGDSADVLVYGSSLTDIQCAQIEDIVKRKTGIASANIIITPVGEK